MSGRSLLLAITVAVLVVGGTTLSIGPPRLVAGNTALRVEYPWFRAVGAAAVVAGGVVLAVLAKRRWLRFSGIAMAMAALLGAVRLSVYRVQADGDGLLSRDLMGTASLGWRDVEHVDARPDMLVVTGRGRKLSVDTTDYRPEQRAALDRTIARRLGQPGRETETVPLRAP